MNRRMALLLAVKRCPGQLRSIISGVSSEYTDGDSTPMSMQREIDFCLQANYLTKVDQRLHLTEAGKAELQRRAAKLGEALVGDVPREHTLVTFECECAESDCPYTEATRCLSQTTPT